VGDVKAPRYYPRVLGWCVNYRSDSVRDSLYYAVDKDTAILLLKIYNMLLADWVVLVERDGGRGELYVRCPYGFNLRNLQEVFSLIKRCARSSSWDVRFRPSSEPPAVVLRLHMRWRK